MLPGEKAPSLALEIGRVWTVIFALLAVIGAVAFLYGISGDLALRSWQVYLAITSSGPASPSGRCSSRRC